MIIVFNIGLQNRINDPAHRFTIILVRHMLNGGKISQKSDETHNRSQEAVSKRLVGPL